MAKSLRVERSVGGALRVRCCDLAKKVVCGVSHAEKAMSLINDRFISKVDLYEALAPSRVYMRPQKLWSQNK